MPSAKKYVFKMRHWVAACKSTVATVTSDDDEQIALVLCNGKTANEVTRSPNGIYKNIFVGEECVFPVRVLVDPGLTHSLIAVDVCEQLQLPMQPTKAKILSRGRRKLSSSESLYCFSEHE